MLKQMEIFGAAQVSNDRVGLRSHQFKPFNSMTAKSAIGGGEKEIQCGIHNKMTLVDVARKRPWSISISSNCFPAQQ